MKNSLAWRAQMKLAPKLIHDPSGLVLVQLGEHSVLFPSEADARFFFDAYTDVPNLNSELECLRGWFDEHALAKATERNLELEAEVAQLRRRVTEQDAQLATLAENAANSAQRARMLACLIRRKTP